MARLSGLASEHHPVGPGDAPRRKKGRKSTPSVDLSHGNKRSASPIVDVSQNKRKRVQIDDHEQLVREFEDSVSRSQPRNDTIRVNNEDDTRRSRRHSEPVVSVPDEEDSQKTPPPSTQPLTGLTPHLEHIGAPVGRPSNARRARMSMPAQLRVEPVDENVGDKQFQFAPLTAVLDGRTRRRLRRSHLSQEVNEIEEHQKEDKKMRQEYAELRRQLREKDQAITDLEFQLEARRLGDIDMTDDRAEELEQELERARKEIEDLRASSIYTGDSREQSTFDGGLDPEDDDEDGLMLIDPDELGVSHEDMEAEPLPNGEYASRALALSSQVTVNSLKTMTETSYDVLAEPSQSDPAAVPDKISDKAVKRYETEIDRLIRQLADSQGTLRVIAVELQNLHVVQPGASSDVIITNLRHGFEAVREELENLLPNCTAGLTNSELLHKIPEFFEGVLAELREKVVVSETHYQNEKLLRSQYEHVLDLLSRSEDRNTELDTKVDELEQDNDGKQRNIAELEERVSTLSDLADNQDTEIQQKTAEINGLKDEVEDKDTALGRLRASLETYREDLDTVTTTATRLEEEHRQAIADMEQVHADVVRDLQAQLDDESEARAQAEGEADQKSEYIEELEERVKLIDNEVNNMTEEIAQLSQRLAEETQGRELAEGQRDDQAVIAYTTANTVENLNETVQDLESQLEDFRNNLQAERSQREQTEAALDEANDKITDLDGRLQDAGLQANELRSKLFQVQQEKDQTIADLQEDARDRESELQEQLDGETQDREAAEQKVAELEAEVTQLNDKIAALEDDIAGMTQDRKDLEKDRDARIAALDAQLNDLKQKYAALENATNSEIATLQANITDLNNEVIAQNAEIERITDDAAETQRILQEELAEKSTTIATLKSDLANAEAENEKLAEENESLSNRVASEAAHLLEIDAAHSRERDALTQAINTQKATIETLENVAAERLLEYEEAIADKTNEIEDLRIVDSTRASLIAELEAQIDEMKERFRLAEEDTRATIDALVENERRLQEQNENLAAAIKKRNADTLKAVQDMKVKGVQVKTKGVELHKVSNGKVSKVSERVKVSKKGGKKSTKKTATRTWAGPRDSGIGVEEDVEYTEEIDEVGAEAVVG